jgi:hypothetical protein
MELAIEAREGENKVLRKLVVRLSEIILRTAAGGK